MAVFPGHPEPVRGDIPWQVLRYASRMEWTPDRIRLFRATGLSLPQRKFAKKLGFTLRTIGNAERGAHPPSLALRRALDQALEQAPETQRNRFLAAEAASQDDERHVASLPLTNSRQLTAHLDGIEQRDETLRTSAGNSAFGWLGAQSLSATATRSVGMTDVRIIRVMTETFRNLDNRFGGGHTRSAVTNYLVSGVLPLLQEGRYCHDVRRELFTTVAELSQVAGWTWYDMGNSDSGRYYLWQAMQLCQDVGDDALAGEMLAGMSHQAAFLQQTAVAIDLAEQPRTTANGRVFRRWSPKRP
ncbi:MAG: helix-turn-helix transcriptional regulator [Pseudonocardiaceae bacterium]